MLDSIPYERDCAVHKLCLELYERFKGDALQVELAKATADEWLEMYRYKPFFEPLPDVTQRYGRLKTDEERKLFNKNNPDWTMSDDIQQYTKRRDKANLENESNKHYLQETCRWIRDDKPRVAKVFAVLAQYPTAKVTVAPVSVDWHD